MTEFTAVEFFSGIGSFADVCRDTGIRVHSAFDQNAMANGVYQSNFGLVPGSTTLDSIKLSQIPDVDIWWMSPPCTPYSVRGKQADIDDPRAKSVLRLLEVLPLKKPSIFFLENVLGFEQSKVRQLLLQTLADMNYNVIEKQLCSTDFGTPMKRPRHFVVASRELTLSAECFNVKRTISPQSPRLPVRSFLDQSFDEGLLMPEAEFRKYEAVLNVIDPNDDVVTCICFTKGYYRCRSASGSLIRLPDGRVRRFSSREILRLLGFSDTYRFPAGVSEEQCAGLLGNAVDVRTIRFLLGSVISLQGARLQSAMPSCEQV